jgi:endogenous inhibitor of DNA gyrase (YacG/DUF329 family)
MVRIDPPVRPCSICGNPVTETRHRPFCSKRCAEIDLGRWLKGIYHVPTNEPAEGGDEPEGSEE